jgi:hypothetical protein
MADPSETTQVSREPPEQEAELVDAVRALAAQVGGLTDDVHALRVEARALPPGESDRHGWDEGAPAVRDGPAWVRSVDSPRARGIAVPWLLLEILFLVAVAVLCAVAGLDAPVIAGVMIAAWLLVALAEWLASRADGQRHALLYGVGVPATASAPDDRSWFESNLDDTLLDAPSAERQPTRLPPPE